MLSATRPTVSASPAAWARTISSKLLARMASALAKFVRIFGRSPSWAPGDPVLQVALQARVPVKRDQPAFVGKRVDDPEAALDSLSTELECGGMLNNEGTKATVHLSIDTYSA